MDKFLVQCIKDVSTFFVKGKRYEAFWDGDGYNEPSSLITTDERGKSPHIIAEHSLEDDWFREHFIVLSDQKKN